MLHLLDDLVEIVEPPWKMLLSNKAILPVLWEMFPDHLNLLPSRARAARRSTARASRNRSTAARAPDVVLIGAHEIGRQARRTASTRRWRRCRVFDGWHALIGSWIVGGKAAGMGMREDREPITRNTSRFSVPHYFV